MEGPGHDVFTQRNEIGEDDPFAGSDFGDWEQDTPENSQPTPIEPLPPEPEPEDPNIESGYDGPVAQEGEVSPNHPAHPQWHEAQEEPVAAQEPVPGYGAALGTPQPDQTAAVAAPAAPQGPELPPAAPPAPPPPPSPSQAVAEAAERERKDEPAPGVSLSTPPSAPQPPEAPPDGSPAPAVESSAAAGAPPAAEDLSAENERREQEGDVPIGLPTLTPEQQAAEAQRYREEHGEPEPPDPTPAEADGTTGSTTDEAAVEPVATEDGDAPMPQETKDKRGRVTHRRYVILRAEDDTHYVQLDWHEKDGKLVRSGGKRQTVVLARGTEEALKFGYHVVDSPPEGAELVAVAAAYFQVRHVAPEPPEPMRQRLKIS
jgi:hypothetical protein